MGASHPSGAQSAGTDRSLVERVDRGAALIVCAGMPRSGSTWAYNAARLVLEDRGGVLVSGWIDDLAREGSGVGGASCVLVKVHAYDAALARRADALVCTHRDLRETVSSMLRVGFVSSEDEALAALKGAVEDSELWEAHASLVLGYSEIGRDPGGCVGRVAAALGVGLSGGDAEALAARIPRDGPRGGGGYDPVTLLHASHTRRGGEPTPGLSEGCERALEERFGRWSHTHGYS